jgi:hypothetical protein
VEEGSIVPLFQVNCPRCQKPTLLGATGQCLNVLTGGTICGYALPIQYRDGNAKYRDKYEKHTTPPASWAMTNGIHSWAFASGDYSQFQEFVMESGSVHLDPASNYLFLWSTPRDSDPVASVFYGRSGCVVSASGALMPLNSKPQNYHHFYSDYEPHFQHVADGPGLIIEAPNDSGTWSTEGRRNRPVRKRLARHVRRNGRRCRRCHQENNDGETPKFRTQSGLLAPGD